MLANITREVPVFGRSDPTQASAFWRRAVPCPALPPDYAPCPVHDAPPPLRGGQQTLLDLDSLLPGLVPASCVHFTPASEILNRAPALADPGVVDANVAEFASQLDPTMPGMYSCLFSAYVKRRQCDI